jgi:hypothetical protein
MIIRPAIRRRICWGTGIGIFLLAVVILLLTFADAYAPTDEAAKTCAPGFGQSKWPMYLGCAMALHEGLAAGLLGGAGAIWAAWLAFQAIQEQIEEERSVRKNEQIEKDELLKRQQAEAKEAAVMCITPTIHAAGSTLRVIDGALKKPSIADDEADRLVALGAEYVKSQLKSFTVGEALNGLGLDDRLIYLAMIGSLSTFVSVSTNPSPHLNRRDRLNTQRRELMNMHTYLKGFDARLAAVYARDSETTPPT